MGGLSGKLPYSLPLAPLLGGPGDRDCTQPFHKIEPDGISGVDLPPKVFFGSWSFRFLMQ